MKKVLVVLGVAAFSLGVMSCKKECKCKIGPLSWEIPSEEGTITTKAECDKVVADYATIGVSCGWK